jgi:septum formation protein
LDKPLNTIILASTSPRRKMLLEQVRIPFIVIPPTADETLPTDGDFGASVIGNALLKARSVIAQAEGRIILGADTIVDLDGHPLGKPTDPIDAHRMLKSLSGRIHRVHTSVVLIDSSTGQEMTAHEITKVTFRHLSDREIDEYIATGEPMDKAGAYGIQERGALFIHKVDGCFFNVMGLPLATLWEMLKKMGNT